VRDGAAKVVFLWNEVGVEHGDELTRSMGETIGQSPGLEASAIGPVEMVDPDAMLSIFLDNASHVMAGLVCRVIQHLDLEAVRGVVEVTDRSNQTLCDVEFVVERELHRNPRPGFRVWRLLGSTMPCAIVEHKQEQPMASEKSQDAEDGVVDEKDRLSGESGHCPDSERCGIKSCWRPFARWSSLMSLFS
jgi:hypothetical protein